MTRPDPLKELMEGTIELARKSKDQLPSIISWCRHIKIKEEFLSPVATTMGLASHFHVSCPKVAASIGGMDLAVMAEGFIADNCFGCSFHSPIHAPNFGTRLKERIAAEKAQAYALKAETEAVKAALKRSIETLIDQQTSTYNPPELLILELVSSLDDASQALASAERLHAAAKMQYNFFTDQALDAMSLYFDLPSLAFDLLSATVLVVSHNKKVPQICLAKTQEVLTTGDNSELVAAIFDVAIDYTQPEKYKDLLSGVIASLDYNRIRPSAIIEKDKKEVREGLVIKFAAGRLNMVADILSRRIKIADKFTRINALRLTDQLLPAHQQLGQVLLPDIISSLEIADPPYYESADKAACRTISNIIISAPDTMLDVFDKGIDTLSQRALLQAMTTYEYLISATSFLAAQLSYFTRFSDKVIKQLTVSRQPSDLRLEYFNLFEHLYKSEALTNITSEVLTGTLALLYDESKLIAHFNEELKNKKTSTFNFLAGLSGLEIYTVKTAVDNYKQKMRRLIENDLKKKPYKCYPVIADVIKNTPSKERADYKVDLLECLRKGLTDDQYKAKFTPQLFSLLFDTEAINVRFYAMNFLESMVEKSPHLLTSNLRELVTVFFHDPNPFIRGEAAKLVAAIAATEGLTPSSQEIEAVIGGLSDPGQKAFEGSLLAIDDVIGYMTDKQKNAVLKLLISKAEMYRERNNIEDPTCQQIVDTMFYADKENKKLLDYLVAKFLTPYSRSEQEPTAFRYLDILKSIKDLDSLYYDLWYSGILRFFSHFITDQDHEYNWEQLFEDITVVTTQVASRNLEEITAAIKEIIKRSPYRVLQFLYLLGYYEMPALCVSMGKELLSAIAPEAANLTYRNNVQLVISCASLQLETDSSILASMIKKTKDELYSLS